MSAAPLPATGAAEALLSAPPLVRRLLEHWHRAECALAVAAFAFIAAVLIIDVFGREVLHPLLRAFGLQPGATGVYGAAKLAVFALAVASYAGLGIAAATATHLVPRVAFNVVPESWAPRIDRIADAFTCAVLLGAAWYSAHLVAGSYATGARAMVLQWPLWPVQMVLPLGFASAALRYGCWARWPVLRPKRAEGAG